MLPINTQETSGNELKDFKALDGEHEIMFVNLEAWKIPQLWYSLLQKLFAHGTQLYFNVLKKDFSLKCYVKCYHTYILCWHISHIFVGCKPQKCAQFRMETQ